MTMSPIVVYVGTYQREDPSSPTPVSSGILAYALDPASGRLTFQTAVTDVDNPSFLAINHQAHVLYAVDENQAPEASYVRAYVISPKTGFLRPLNKQPSEGSLPCHVSVDSASRFVAVANYGSGTVSLLPIGEAGRLLPATDRQRHNGSGPVPARQAAPHAHSANFDDTGRFLFVADLGIDKIMCYEVDAVENKLVPCRSPNLDLPAGCGPRHMAFHPNGRFAYVINELSSTITALAYDAAGGTFSSLHTVSTLPADFQGPNLAAEISITPSGKYLYGSNRGHDSLAIFAIDEESGLLTALAHQSTGGRTPRHFTFDPNGAFVVVANQDSNNIVVFRLNQDTGLLKLVHEESGVPRPVCLRAMDLS